MNEQCMCTACIVHTLYRDTSGSGLAMWYQIVLSDVLTAYQAMDRFSIDSLLNHCTAARTPLKLMYWTTRALSVGSPPQNTPWVWRRDIFFRLAAHFSVYFSKDVWSIRVGQRAFVVEHTISWLTSVAYVQPCPPMYSVINVATWPSKQAWCMRVDLPASNHRWQLRFVWAFDRAVMHADTLTASTCIPSLAILDLNGWKQLLTDWQSMKQCETAEGNGGLASNNQ